MRCDARSQGLRFRSADDDLDRVAVQARNSFARLIVALLANAAEHAIEAEGLETLFELDIAVSDADPTITVVNEAPILSNRMSASSFGTTGVMRAMLSALNGVKVSQEEMVGGRKRRTDKLLLPIV